MYVVRSGALMGYTALVSNLGNNPVQLIKQVGLSPAHLRDRNNYLSYKKVADLLAVTAEQIQDPMFGFRLASMQGFVISGELAYGLGVQATLGDFFRYLSEHLSLHANGARMELNAFDDLTRIQLHFDFTNNWGLQHLLQMSVGQIMRSFGDQPPALLNRFKIHVRQSEPEAYEKVALFQRYLVFDSEFDGLQFPSELFSRALKTNPTIYRQYFERRIKKAKRQFADSLPSQVKYLLSGVLATGEYSLQHIASSLDLHSRVLQRRLKANGTSFSKLLKETRRDIACQHLCDGEVNITDVALKLGYAEVAIFSRHFKQWTGLSPRQWRKEKGKERP